MGHRWQFQPSLVYPLGQGAHTEVSVPGRSAQYWRWSAEHGVVASQKPLKHTESLTASHVRYVPSPRAPQSVQLLHVPSLAASSPYRYWPTGHAVYGSQRESAYAPHPCRKPPTHDRTVHARQPGSNVP